LGLDLLPRILGRLLGLTLGRKHLLLLLLLFLFLSLLLFLFL
jgi:hypothetical protein